MFKYSELTPEKNSELSQYSELTLTKFRIVPTLQIKVGNHYPYSENIVRIGEYSELAEKISALALPLQVQLEKLKFLNFIWKTSRTTFGKNFRTISGKNLQTTFVKVSELHSEKSLYQFYKNLQKIRKSRFMAANEII